MKRIFNYLYYIKDIISDFSSPNVKIERITLDASEEHIMVSYRLGRQMLIQRSNISDFEIDSYSNLSVHDKQRLTKFLTLQGVLTLLREEKGSAHYKFIKYLQDEIKHDKLL
jgi:hypothetical protein